MSAGDKYYTAPLSILRSGKSHLEVLEAVVACGIVNAGIGYRKDKGEDAFKQLLEDANKEAVKQGHPAKSPKKLSLRGTSGSLMTYADAEMYWKYAHAGWKLLGILGGDRASDAQTWLDNPLAGGPFFKMRSDWIWGAVNQARREIGKEVASSTSSISWREFKIIAAILSAGCNDHGFVLLGWESIQARACGFHSKALFQSGKASLPSHCLPLSRDQITLTVERLEGLKFFLRYRDSKGKSGGRMAYSLRHATRELLAESVAKWKAENARIETQIEQNRAADLALSLQKSQNPQVWPQHKEGFS